MTKKQSVKFVATKMDIPKCRLKNKNPLSNEWLITDAIELMHEKALNNLIDYLKENIEENVSYEVLRAFAVTYFDLKVTQEYDVKIMDYKLVCIPKWKDVNEIDMKSEEFKLLEEYSWECDLK